MAWIIKRTGQAVATVFAVVSLTFGMIRLLPGGPMDYMKAHLSEQAEQGTVSMSREEINAMVEVYTNVHPDEPLLDQYVSYVIHTLQGDLGQSVWQQEPVSAILAEALPWTVLVSSLALVFSFTIGIGLGAAMAYKEESRFDFTLTSVSIFLTSIPYYVFAIIAIYVFAYELGWFPDGGYLSSGARQEGFSLLFIIDALHHAALPVASLVITGFGGRALAMRGNSIRILGEDYLRVARLRGLPQRVIISRYVSRNAILPMYTSLMISIGFMFGGSVILETLFTYPGVGYYMFQAINQRDYPLMMGGFLVITVAVVIGIYIADLTYGKIDPRIEQSGEREVY